MCGHCFRRRASVGYFETISVPRWNHLLELAECQGMIIHDILNCCKSFSYIHFFWSFFIVMLGLSALFIFFSLFNFILPIFNPISYSNLRPGQKPTQWFYQWLLIDESGNHNRRWEVWLWLLFLFLGVSALLKFAGVKYSVFISFSGIAQFYYLILIIVPRLKNTFFFESSLHHYHNNTPHHEQCSFPDTLPPSPHRLAATIRRRHRRPSRQPGDIFFNNWKQNKKISTFFLHFWNNSFSPIWANFSFKWSSFTIHHFLSCLSSFSSYLSSATAVLCNRAWPLLRCEVATHRSPKLYRSKSKQQLGIRF